MEEIPEVLKRIRFDIVSGIEIEKCRDMLAGFLRVKCIDDDDLEFLCRLLSIRTPREKLIRKIDKLTKKYSDDGETAIAMNPLYVPDDSLVPNVVNNIIHKCIMNRDLDTNEKMFLCHNVPYFRNVTDCRRYIMDILGYGENYTAAIPKIFYILMSNSSDDKLESIRFCRYVLGMCSPKIKELIGDVTFGFDHDTFISMWKKARSYSTELDNELANILENTKPREGNIRENHSHLYPYYNKVRIFVMINERKPAITKLFVQTIVRWLKTGEIRDDDILIIDLMRERNFPLPYFIYASEKNDAAAISELFGHQSIKKEYKSWKHERKERNRMTNTDLGCAGDVYMKKNIVAETRASQMITELTQLFSNNSDSETILSFLPAILDTSDPLYESVNEILVKHGVYESNEVAEFDCFKVLEDIRSIKNNTVA